MIRRDVWSRAVAYVICTLVLALFVWCFWVGFFWTVKAIAAPERCASTACLERAVAWQKHDKARLQRQLAVHWEPTIDYACRLGRVVYGVPVAHCKRVIRCESENNRWLINSPGRDTARGYAQFLPSTWAGTVFGRARFSIFDPIAPVLQMDAIAATQGFDTSYGWAASYHCHHLSGPEA